jgi:hypothetical protein
MIRIDDGHQHTDVRHSKGVPSITPDDSADLRTYLAGIIECQNQIRAHLLFETSTAYGKYQDHVLRPQAANSKPLFKNRCPPVIIRARCQFGDVVGGRIGFDSGDLAEVIYCVGCVGGAAPDAQNEEAPMLFPGLGQQRNQAVDSPTIQLVDDRDAFVEERLGKAQSTWFYCARLPECAWRGPDCRRRKSRIAPYRRWPLPGCGGPP